MVSIAIIGIKLGEKVRDNLYSISEFTIIDIGELEKVSVGIEYIKENSFIVCDTYPISELTYYLRDKNEVYTDGKNIYCCDSIADLYVNENKHKYYELDLVSVGIVLIDDKVLVNKDDCIAYTSEFRDKFAAIVYKPYTDEIEMCYRDKEKDDECHNGEYSVFYSVGSNIEFASTLSNNILYAQGVIFDRDDIEPIILYNDYVLDTLYEVAECRDNVFRIGNVHWTDDWLEKDTFIIENGCQAFFIIAESLNADTLVFPPSIKIFGSSDEAGLLVRKVYLSKALKGSRIVGMVEDNVIVTPSTPDLEIEYY